MKLDAKTIMLVVSAILNVLGGLGVVPPVAQVNTVAPSPCAQIDAGVQ